MSDDDEPSTLTERLAYLESVARQANAQKPEAAPFRCRCKDTGWVFTDEETNTVMPCERCRPESYERWQSGAWLPSHLRRTEQHIPQETPRERPRRDTA